MPDNGLNPQWSQVNFACAVWSPEQTLLKAPIYNSKSSPNPDPNPNPSPRPDPNLTRTLTLLKVSIYNSKSSLLGKGSKVLLAYAMVPVCALRNGFRSLPLRPLGFELG